MAVTKRERQNGFVWEVRVTDLDPMTGKRKPINGGTFKTKKEAQAREAEILAQKATGSFVKRDKTTVAELLDEWLRVEMPLTVRPENRQPYEIVVNKHLKPALGTKKVQHLTVEDVERLSADLQQRGYSTSLIKKCLLRLSSALSMARRWGLVQRNVCDDARKPKTATKTPDVWSPAEVEAFLVAARQDADRTLKGGEPDMRDGLGAAYWELATETGARVSELLGLAWSDFDSEKRTLTIGNRVVRLLHGTPLLKDDAKSAAGRRTIRLTPGMADALKAHRGRWAARKLAATAWESAHELIFSTDTGRPINPAHIRRSFARLVRLAGVKRLTPHGMRRTHITQTVADGGNIKAVAARVGHRDVATTLQIYTRLVPQMEEDLMAIVEQRHRRPEAQLSS